MAEAIPKEKFVDDILSLGVSEVIERDHLEAALKSGKKLRVKLGIDPTSPNLHLGHAVSLWKMRAFQDLGHKAVLIIGDFTARVGDPSGREDARKPLTEAEIKENMQEYLAQAGRILDLDKVEVRHNSEWLANLGLNDVTKLLGAATAAQILKREDFAKRMEADSDITMFETFYPLLQGYDSVAVKADVELGGHDQLLNLLMGRKVQRHYGMAEQDILTTPLLIGLDGKKKMSKSLGNVIGLTDQPEDVFGKIMSLPDELMDDYFVLAAGLPKDTSSDWEPKLRKEKLAEVVVARYCGEEEGRNAKLHFEKVFSKKEINAKNLPVLKIEKLGETTFVSPVELAFKSGIAKSNSEARRLVEQGAVSLNETVKNDPDEAILIHGGEVLKVGKKSFFRIERE